MAASALRIRSMTFSASRGQKAMPIEAVRNTSCSCSWKARPISASTLRASCATVPRLSASLARSSTNIANSSPARRPITVSCGSARIRRSVRISSVRSPAEWPKVSLISLKRSMSRYSSASEVLLRSARDGLLQQVLELHAVRHLGQRLVAREITNAPLGALALGDVANHEDRALVLRIVGRDLRTGDGDRNGLAMTRLDHGLARVRRGAQHVELAALAF